MLMAEGHIVYQGDAMQSTVYFAQIGYVCPIFVNPADYYMRILAIDYPMSQ